MHDPIQQFHDYLEDYDLYPNDIIVDGEIHRFSTNGNSSDKAGWYVLFDNGDDLFAGRFGDFRMGIDQTWHSKSKENLKHNERQELERKLEKAKAKDKDEKEARAKKGREKAKEYWYKGKPAAGHSYLTQKGVGPNGLKQDQNGNLLIPLIDLDENIHGMQTIAPDGNKKFILGSSISRHFYSIHGDNDVLYVCEGYATGASIHKATGKTIFCAMNAGNLGPVAETIRAQYSYAHIVIAADNDEFTEGNPGLTKAREAANGNICFVTWPEFGEGDLKGKPTDFNDYYQLYGKDKTASALKRLEKPDCIIEIQEGRLPKIVDQAEKLLILIDGSVYQYGNILVRPMKSLKNESTQRVQEIWVHNLQERLTKVCKWKKFDGRSNAMVEKDCPRKVCDAYLSRNGEWNVPDLIGVIETPTLRQDGSILQEAGYDPPSRLLFHPGENIFPAIPQEPTKEQAKKALSEIFDLIAEFPFVEEADKSVAVAALLTAIVRRSLPSSPLFAISSPAPGTGKSELIDMISLIATGHPSSVSSQGKNEEEMEKRLGTALLEGNSIINIDNIERPLKGQVLCQMLTQQMVKIRILGQSKSRDLPSIATIFANGNNLVLSGDLIRRSLLCRLDAKTERPEERIFKRNLTDYIYTNRGEIVKAVLTILRAYHVSGKPDLELKPFGSFEIWSQWIRGTLVWLGMEDPISTKEKIRGNDPELANLRKLFVIWYELFGSKPMTLKDAISQVTTGGNEKEINLRMAFEEIAMWNDHIDTRKLGNYINKFKNRVIEGMRLSESSTYKHAKMWKIEKTENQ